MKYFSFNEMCEVTQKHIDTKWSGRPPGNFRCGICNHKFKIGDKCRWIMANTSNICRQGNFVVCEACIVANSNEDLLRLRADLEIEVERLYYMGLSKCSCDTAYYYHD